jgi:hypothetical protein
MHKSSPPLSFYGRSKLEGKAAQHSVPEVRRDNALDAGDCRFAAVHF